MKRLTLEEHREHLRLVYRKFDFTGNHQLAYNTFPYDVFPFVDNRIYPKGEMCELNGVKYVAKIDLTEPVADPLDRTQFTPYQDEQPNQFVLNEFIISEGIIRYYEEKQYRSLKYISQAFKTPDRHPEYWEEVIQEEIEELPLAEVVDGLEV